MCASYVVYRGRHKPLIGQHEHRNYGWPDSATLDRVVSNGCDVVHVAHRQCRQHESMDKLQHRLSFSRAEIVLINSWMPVQQITWCEIGPKLLLISNRKSHTPFRLVPKSTTLDDLERPIRILFQKRCVFRSPPQKNE